MSHNPILNTREIKVIKERLIAQFGVAPAEDYAYLQGKNNKISLVNKDIQKIDLNGLRIDRVGLYFAEVMDDGSVRLSKEGAQLLVGETHRQKKKLLNTVELSAEEVRSYFQGNDLSKDLGLGNRFVLLFFNNNCLGCAKYKENTILNFLPKIHRGEVIV